MRLITAKLAIGVLALALAGCPRPRTPGDPGLPAPDFSFTVKAGYLSTPEGGSIHFWGYAAGNGPAQYPGPTMIINQGETITVDLHNDLDVAPSLDVAVSMGFPGQGKVLTRPVSGATRKGLFTLEAKRGGTVRYTFSALQPGTYLYQSATDPDLQIEMGLVGAIIVRPAGYDEAAGKRAYASADSAYDREVLFLLTEMDPVIHRSVELGGLESVNTNTFFPAYWFINGRCAPDTMAPPNAGWLPSQPYDCMPMMYPGEKLLMRVIGGGRDMHPFHFHGNNATVIARNGRLLSSDGGVSADLAQSLFTIDAIPGQTVDAVFEWTGANLGWDIYGHGPDDPLEPGEDPVDHGKPFPVLLPEKQDLMFGGMWSGSPFLGALGSLPPGEGGMNPMGGFTYMWHSHNEKEMINNGIFPGGMMTMLMIMPHSTMPMPMPEPTPVPMPEPMDPPVHTH